MINIDIIGGGPAGLASAYFAKKNKIPFQLFESGSKVGGNCKTLEFDGCRYDVGAHRFHNKNKIATDTVKSLLGKDLLSVVAPSKISCRGSYGVVVATPFDVILSSVFPYILNLILLDSF